METKHIVFYMFFCILAHCDKSLACQKGSQPECDTAPFVPGYNLAGEGFDVVKMHRKGAFLINVKSHMDNGTCTICENRFQGGQIQKLPSVVLDWRQISRCSNELSSALYHSVESLLKSSSSLINKWEMDLSLDDLGKVIFGGSHSDIAQFANSQKSTSKARFILHEISCTCYSYRVKDHPELSTEFSKHLQKLPAQYDDQTKPLYRKIIDTYGTHYIRQVHLGGRVRRVTAFHTCLATLNGYSETDIKNCLNIELRIILGFLPADASLSNKCSQILKDNKHVGLYQGFMTHKLEVLGGEKYFPDLVSNPADDYKSWMESLHDNPDVISYTIYPLHHLVEDAEVRANLKSAVTEYIKENMVSVDNEDNRNCAQTPNLDHNCCPMRSGSGKLEVYDMRATGMNEDYYSATDGFVKVWYNGMHWKTSVILNNNNPVWNNVFNFGSIEFGHELKFEVWDSDVHFDDLVGVCVLSPKDGTYLCSCQLQRGIFYFTYKASCDAHLTGPRCGTYSP